MASSAAVVDTSQLLGEMRKLTEFVDNVLKVRLSQAIEDRDKILEEKEEYQAVVTYITEIRRNALKQMENVVEDYYATTQKHSDTIDSLVDLGQGFFVRAQIQQSQSLILSLGLHIHVELSLDEALSFIANRIVLLERIYQNRQNKCSEISQDIRDTLKVIEDTSKEMSGSLRY